MYVCMYISMYVILRVCIHYFSSRGPGTAPSAIRVVQVAMGPIFYENFGFPQKDPEVKQIGPSLDKVLNWFHQPFFLTMLSP